MIVTDEFLPRSHGTPIPKNWQLLPLGHLCDLIRGVTFERSEARSSPSPEHLPILRAGNIGDKLDIENDLIWVPSSKVSPVQRMRTGDIVICMSSGSASVVGKTAPLREPFDGSVGSFCGIIRPRSPESADYLAYWLRSPQFIEWRDSQARGANIQNLRLSQLDSLFIPVPPLAEQRRIAAMLTEQMAAVERARQATKSQQELGKGLSIAWRDTKFRELLARNERILSIGECSERITDGTHQPPGFTSSGVPFLFVSNIVRGTLDFETTKFVSDETYQSLTRRFRPSRGDVLYSAVGSFGVAVVVDTDRPFTFQRHIAVIRTNPRVLLPEFLTHFLNSSYGRRQSDSSALGGAQRTVTLKSLASFNIPIPSIDCQQDIVDELTQRLGRAQEIEKLLEQQTLSIIKMPEALLRHSFRGAH